MRNWCRWEGRTPHQKSAVQSIYKLSGCLLIFFQPPLAPPVLGGKEKLGVPPTPPAKGLWLSQLWEEKGKIGGHLHPSAEGLAEGKSSLHFPVQKHPLGRAILSPNPTQTKRPLFLKERPLKISGGDGGESNSL